MTPKILVDLDFSSIIGEASANTQTGLEVLNKYQSYVLSNAESCDVINSFIREASQHLYDNGIFECLNKVTSYINDNKVSWELASACERLNNNKKSYNTLNLNACKQVEKLLENEEEDVVRYIRAGALKNVMYCESFRNITKQVFKDRPIVESKADYTIVTPISFIENTGDGFTFVAANGVYKIDNDKNIHEEDINHTSNTFRTLNRFLLQNNILLEDGKMNVKVDNIEYIIEGLDNIVKKTISSKGEKKQTFTVESFRDHVRLLLMSMTPMRKQSYAGVYESIALLAENYNNVAKLDNVKIFTTKNDKFLVIESDEMLYATLIQSNRHPKWTVNENSLSVLSFIKSKTNTELNEEYTLCLEKAMDKEEEKSGKMIKEELQRKNAEEDLRHRISTLTERFKNDPSKLAILAKLSADLQEAIK